VIRGLPVSGAGRYGKRDTFVPQQPACVCRAFDRAVSGIARQEFVIIINNYEGSRHGRS
jgi:hypothetical protein